MEELTFNCPKYLAQRFWLMCAERDETPGSVLREFMMREIASTDASFEFDLRATTGRDAWEVAKNVPHRTDRPAQAQPSD